MTGFLCGLFEVISIGVASGLTVRWVLPVAFRIVLGGLEDVLQVSAAVILLPELLVSGAVRARNDCPPKAAYLYGSAVTAGLRFVLLVLRRGLRGLAIAAQNIPIVAVGVVAGCVETVVPTAVDSHRIVAGSTADYLVEHASGSTRASQPPRAASDRPSAGDGTACRGSRASAQVLREVAGAARRDEPLRLFAPLPRRRNLADVRDVADVLVRLAERSTTGTANIGTGDRPIFAPRGSM